MLNSFVWSDAQKTEHERLVDEELWTDVVVADNNFGRKGSRREGLDRGPRSDASIGAR